VSLYDRSYVRYVPGPAVEERGATSGRTLSGRCADRPPLLDGVDIARRQPLPADVTLFREPLTEPRSGQTLSAWCFESRDTAAWEQLSP